jgi:membrane protein implicated in regulation of membrane protease activity
MRKDVFLLGVGVCVFLTPFLGVPESWKAMLLVVLGMCTICIALMYRLSSRQEERTSEEVLFEEHQPLTHRVEHT